MESSLFKFPKNTTHSTVLVTGPCRSGKSRWAEHVISHYDSVTYLATGQSNPNDKDWLKRIEFHKKRRPVNWNLLEKSDDLSQTILQLADNNIILDSLGGFVTSNIDKDLNEWLKISEEFLYVINSHKKTIVIVIEETGWSIVPSSIIGNLFRDRLGSLAQNLEEISSQSWLVVQGRAIDLTKIGYKVPS